MRLHLGWVAFSDLGAPGHDPTDNAFALSRVSGGALGSDHSLHYAGQSQNLVGSSAAAFGSGVLFKWREPCADLSAFAGIAFWAKSDVEAEQIRLTLIVPRTNSVVFEPIFSRGDCLSECGEHPYQNIELSRLWVHYQLAFADFGGGGAKVEALVQAIGWFATKPAWDFSIDEVTLYGAAAP